MAFKSSSINPSHLAELMQDGAVKTMLESFLAPRLIKPRYVKQVSRKTGSVDLAGPSMLTPDARATLNAKVGDFGDTAILHQAMGVLEYACQDYRIASALPQNVYVSEDAALQDLVDLLIYNAGVTVKASAEGSLLDILKGVSGSTATSLSGKEWDAYGDADHNPVLDLFNARKACGANILVLGENVAIALMQSPKLTGSSAGGGTEFLTQEQLVAKIMGIGYNEVWIGTQCWSRSAGLNQTGTIGQIHDNVACAFVDGAIQRMVYEEFQFDQYEDKNKDAVLFRAKESSIIKSTYATSVIAFTNVLAG